MSFVPDGTDISEAVLGASWLKLPLTVLGEQIAGVMNAMNGSVPCYDTVAVMAPRRSAKTTSVYSTLLGRCLKRDDYQISSTAQDGTRSRLKMRELLQTLERAGFPAATGARLFFANGAERIEFANGSIWRAVNPDPDNFRSMAFDAVLIDEAGELDPDKADELLAGVLPTLDTRPDAQVITAGTPGLTRAGLLWATLEDLAAGAPGVGGVVYAARDTDTFADFSDPDNPVYDLDLLQRTHPGIQAGLTTLERVFSRLPKMGLTKFCSEYLCQWPRTAGTSALDVDAWHQCAARTGLPVRPDRVGLAWDVDPSGEKAALVAAWRTEDGKAHFEVLGCEPGSTWLPAKIRAAELKHRTASVYDAIGMNLETAERAARAPHRCRTRALRMRDMIGAAARIELEIKRRQVVHYEQSDLTAAVEGASWRPAGVDGRLFGRKASASSVACLVAASAALWSYDVSQRSGERPKIRSTATR